jgi:hypothetical protein
MPGEHAGSARALLAARCRPRHHPHKLAYKLITSDGAQRYEVHPNQIYACKKQLLDQATRAFGSGGGNAAAGREREIERFHAEIGQLIAEEVRKMTPRTAERSTIVTTASFRSDANPSCSASRLWCLSACHPPPTNDLGLMRRIDDLFTPGRSLARGECDVNRKALRLLHA